MTLFEALPDLAHDVWSALIREGRGRIADQLRDTPLVSFDFDEFAHMTYLWCTATREAGMVKETISFFEDLGVNVDIDNADRIVGLEVFGHAEAFAGLRCADPS